MRLACACIVARPFISRNCQVQYTFLIFMWYNVSVIVTWNRINIDSVPTQNTTIDTTNFCFFFFRQNRINRSVVWEHEMCDWIKLIILTIKCGKQKRKPTNGRLERNTQLSWVYIVVLCVYSICVVCTVASRIYLFFFAFIGRCCVYDIKWNVYLHKNMI